MPTNLHISKIAYCFLLLVLLISCNSKKERHVIRGFYYWKTNVNISPYEQAYMDTLKTSFVYTRFFDVDVSSDGQSIQPLAVINFGEQLPKQPIIPVVFITPRALNLMQWNTLDLYAQRIAQLLEKKAKQINLVPKEIQIDCDWTAKNKDLYFSLLQKLKSQSFFKNKQLSVTIRLHQIKYATAAGLPPVDKGLLMVYNMDKLDDIKVGNSILNVDLAKDYLKNVQHYPLPLDIALPIFSWTVQFENNNIKGIIRNFKAPDFTNTNIFKNLERNKSQVLIDTMYKGYDLRKGQVLRFENSNINDVQMIADFLTDNLERDSLNLMLYHCDSINFSKYPTNELEKVFSTFR